MARSNPRDAGSAFARNAMGPAGREFLRLLRRLPKAELHVHLEGSLTPEEVVRMRRWAGASGAGVPPTATEVRAWFRRVRDMAGFLDTYVPLMRLFRGAEPVAWAAGRLAQRLATAGFVAAEVTVTAAVHLRWGLPVGELRDGLAEGRRRAAEKGVDLRFVLDAVRTLPWSLPATVTAAETLCADEPGLVVGLGLAGLEATAPAGGTTLRTLRAAADRLGLVVLPHAGEFGPPGHVREAIEAGGAPRVGHGISVVRDPAVAALARRRGTVFEVCPDSNLRLGAVPGLCAHPLVPMVRAGLRVVPCTDDPGIFELDPLASYRFALASGAPVADVIRSARTSLEAAIFLADRVRHLQRFDAVVAAWRRAGSHRLATAAG